jgi:hypothetical protein
VIVRARPGGVAITVRGVGARDGERLAPIAARIRRALPAGPRAGIRGTSAFEDAVAALLDDPTVPGPARDAVFRQGPRCPHARALRAMPPPEALARRRRALGRAGVPAALARRLQALARAFAAMAPSEPMRA